MQTLSENRIKEYDDDEISLWEIYEILRENWKALTGFIFVSGMLALVLAYVLPKKYEVSVYVQDPLPVQYMDVNTSRTALSGLDWVTGKDLYGYFVDSLTSDAARQRFFEKIYLPSLDEQPKDEAERNALYATVSKKLVVVNEPKSNKGRQHYNIVVQAPTDQAVVEWTKGFLDLVQDEARQKWVEGEKKTIAVKIENLEKNLAEKYELTKKLRLDREVRLEEAFKVAQAVDQELPQVTVGQLPKQESITPFADGSALYARGTKSLGAEIDVLSNRKDESAFIEGIRELQGKVKALKEQELHPESVGMYRIDGQLLRPAKPVSPKKLLILAVGLLLGGFAGLLFVFVRRGAIMRRAEQEALQAQQARA